MLHFDKSGWIIQERKLVDFRGMRTTHIVNHPILKLVQILAPVKSCVVLICCKEDVVGILKYMMVSSADSGSSEELCRPNLSQGRCGKDFEVYDGLETRMEEFQGPTKDKMKYGGISHNES